MLDWAENEVVVPSGPFEGYEFAADRLPYARLLLGELGKWQRHVITGPTQSGKSFHAFVLPIMYYLFERQEDVIVGIPDINMAGDKWAEDIKPVIEKSSYAHLLPTKGQGSKGAGKLQKVTFENGRFMRFMSAGGNDKQRAGATARILIVTETDGMDVVAESSQEGQSKIQQLEGRVRSYGDNAVVIAECTVSTADAYTWSEYQAGTASKIVHPCPSCGVYVSPEREHLIGWEDADNEIEAAENGRFTCPECGVFYSEEDRIEMNRRALLVHRGQEVTPSGEIVGQPPKTRTLGFRWSAFQNLLNSTAMLAAEEWKAKHSDEPELADIARKQQAWALPAENPNVEKTPLDVSIVCGKHPKYAGRCAGVSRGQVPDGSDILTAFVDVARKTLQWSVEAKVNGRIHVVDYGFHQTELPDVVGDDAAITDAIKELTSDLQGRFPGLHLGLVDCGNWRETILNCLQEVDDLWRPSHGLPNYKHPSLTSKGVVIPEDGSRLWHWSEDGDSWVANFNPDAIKHAIHSGFQIKPLAKNEHSRGCVTLFGSDPNEHVEFAKQITAEVFIREFVKGKGIVERWDKVNRNNHLLDTSVGNKLARLIVANWRHTEALAHMDHEDAGAMTTPDGRPFYVGNR